MGVHASPSTSGRILLDARPLQGASALRGIGTYVRGLFDGLREQGFDRRLALLMDGDEALPPLPEGDYVVFTVRRRYQGRLAPWEDAVALPRDLERIAPRLFHGTTLSLPSRLPCPMVVTVHDLIPWAMGGRSMLGERIRYRIGRGMIGRASVVIAPSQATADDTVRLAGAAPSRVRVVPEAVDSRLHRVEDASGAGWGIEKPFLLYVGALDARKDPAALLRAWQVARSKGADCELVLAGAAGRQAPASMGDARRLGYVSTADLAKLLSAASCLIFPSRYEGFGLPVLEAMACGCPVVAYRNSSIPEAMGDAGTMVEDGDATAMGEAAAAYLLDPALARRAREEGQRQAARFSWRKAARATIAVYGEALSER